MNEKNVTVNEPVARISTDNCTDRHTFSPMLNHAVNGTMGEGRSRGRGRLKEDIHNFIF